MGTFKLKSDANIVRENAAAAGNVLANDGTATQVTQVKTSSGAFVTVSPTGITLQGTYGFLTIMSDGSYSYVASTAAADQLKAGATASDTFTYAAINAAGTSATTTLKLTVTGVNDAPVLVTPPPPLNAITEDQTTNSGQLVSTFLNATDADSSALRGVALTGLTSGNGTWQYSINNRASWISVGSVSETTALLLRSTDYIRFVPNGSNGTAADISYHAWDQTSGAAGARVDATTNGGETAFSTATATASILVSDVNDAPVAIASSASGSEDGPDITGTVQATDVDSGTLSYALVANSAVGGSVVIDAATGNYSFTPGANFSGTGSFRFTASDGSLTSASAAVTITVAGVNDAPVLTSTPATLNAITEDQTTNAGQLVSSFLNSTDPDPNALRGIALSGMTSGNGQWQYSINGGTSWTAVGTVSEASALLLRSTDYVRFVPNGIAGTTADLTYHAWDQTSGAAGTSVDVTVNGGGSAFSSASATASILVSDVNDAPVATASSASGTEDGPVITGTVSATDVDSNTLTYALVANSAVGGSVSIDAATGNYSFTPAANFSGTGSFRFTASDGSATSASAPVTITVAGVNDPPTAVNDSVTTGKGVSILVNVLANDSDVDGNPLTIATVGAAGHGTAVIENGLVRYTPASGFTGSDSFLYSISDGFGGTAQARADITVQDGPAPPSAVSISFRQDANGYTGAVDTMLKQNVASTAYGDSIVLRSGLETGKDEQVLMKFASLFGSGPGQIPVGAQIVSAVLQLDATASTIDGGTLNRMLVNWSASSTWNSLGSGVQTNGVEATATGIALGAVALGSHSIDVTESLIAWNAAASTSAGQNAANLGWLFNPTSTDIWDFSSAQGQSAPTLIITYTQRGTTLASLPSVSIASAGPAAENSGAMTFNVTLSQAASEAVTINLSTSDHTAIAGSDYLAAARSITIAAGQTSASFDIGLVNNSVGERLETFNVQIDSATNATIGTAVAVGKIIDDDAVVPAMPTLTPSIVATYNISNPVAYPDGSGTYGISDPSGLAYIPSLGTLFIADSEHDESPFFSQTNMFSVRLDGTYVGNYGLRSFTSEPTGLGYNPNNGFLYIADDDKYAVSWVSPTNPSVRLGVFDTRHLGFLDTEDLKIDPLTGHIHILDGTLKQMVELTDTGTFVDSVALPTVMPDAEALAYDPVHDLYFVASGASKLIWILNAQGEIQATMNLFSGYSHFQIKGMEIAPSSDPNDGDAISLYVADYGNDQVNDGRMFEVHLGSDWFAGH